MQSSDPNFYSSSSSESSVFDEDDNSGLHQIINGVKNSLNLSRSKSDKSGAYNKSRPKTTNVKSKSEKEKARPLNGEYITGGDYSSDSEESDSSSDSSDEDSSSSIDRHEEKSEKVSDKEKGNESTEDYSDDEDEGEEGYKVGGYHRVKVGEVYNQRSVF